MSLIEGIGDEVIQFLGLSLGILLAVIAWYSTRISDLPQIRAILIVETRPQTESEQQSSNSDVVQDESALPSVINDNSSVNSNDNYSVAADGTPETVNVESDQDINLQPPREVNPEATVSEPKETESSTENRTDNIRIRLKYLNDDQKLVDGRLQELLGDFKKRHFSVELSRQKRVRLIFNGQVLQSDDQTLQGYGLYDNCVVHCLIHTQPNNLRSNTQQSANIAPPDWNLGILLCACLSLVLCFAWFCRYHYSHLFTLTTTATLVSLTGMFVVSIIGTYFSDGEVVPS
ncbi:hypothetical protein O3M35_010075 [Rhynocoris fuscipes]|uniref:Ubiquitin-like domain-containing protein n=1 Tax=Rhynocoris fuscipes TaxID=488301 RepID=A0AAW1CXZ1_9HEMI